MFASSNPASRNSLKKITKIIKFVCFLIEIKKSEAGKGMGRHVVYLVNVLVQ
jgi:hypothetical protein